MKRLIALFVSVALVLSVLPSSVFAIKEDDPKFDQFLTKIGWSKEDYVSFLESKEWYLEDFDDVSELGTPLDEETVQQVMSDFDLTREELNALLAENGDIEAEEDVLEGTYIIFNEELPEYVAFYLEEETATPITEENLAQLISDYGFSSKEELEAFFNEFDDSISNYETIEELEEALLYYLSDWDYSAELESMFTELGLTEEELDRLFAHLETLNYEDPAFLDKLMELSDRMAAFEEFETATELTAQQLAELLDIFTQLQDLFQINTVFYLVKNGEKQSVSLSSLFALTELSNTDLLIEVYDKQGTFLADILLTADMIGSDLIKETGDDLKEAEEVVTKQPQAAPQKAAPQEPAVKTVKGGKLPKTASDYAANAAAGLAMALLGFFLFRRTRKMGM